MALFDKKDEEANKTYVALMDSSDELIAFVSPAKGVPAEMLVQALKDKGLNVEVKESKADRVEITL